MKTVQVSRRSASYRRRLLAAGALSAVVALSHVESAFAAAFDGNCPTDSGDLYDADGDGDPDTAHVASDCYCNVGFMPDGADDCTACPTGTALLTPLPITNAALTTCGGIAPGYFGTAKADDSENGDPTACNDSSDGYASATLAHITSSTTAAGATTTKTACKTKPGHYLSVVHDGTDSTTETAEVGAGKYGAGGVALSATTDDTRTDCPYGEGTIGSATTASTIAECDLCTDASLELKEGTNTCHCAENYYGTVDASDGSGCTTCGASQESPAGSTAASACVTAPGYYLQTANAVAASAVVAQSPANWYSVGGVSVTDTTKASGTRQLARSDSSATKDIQLCPSGTPFSAAESESTEDCYTDFAQAVAAAVDANTDATECEHLWFNTDGQMLTGEAGRADSTAVHMLMTKSNFDGTFNDFSDCVVKEGYYLVALGSAAATSPRVARAPAGFYARGGASATAGEFIPYSPAELASATPVEVRVVLFGKTTLGVCAANSNSDAGSAFCTCDDGYIPALGGASCQPFDVSVTATTAAASPTADSAGASTPIAVALAAAAAVPLLL